MLAMVTKRGNTYAHGRKVNIERSFPMRSYTRNRTAELDNELGARMLVWDAIACLVAEAAEL